MYMPVFIPESLLQKEKDHVEGFAPEVAWVTQGGDNKLPERLVVVRHQKHFSAITIIMQFSLTETFLCSTTSGQT